MNLKNDTIIPSWKQREFVDLRLQEIRLLLELRDQREVDIKGTKLFIKRLVLDWLHKKAIAAQARLPQQLPPRPSSLAPAPAPVERRVNMLPLYNCERDSKLAEQFLELGISGFVATHAAEWHLSEAAALFRRAHSRPRCETGCTGCGAIRRRRL